MLPNRCVLAAASNITRFSDLLVGLVDKSLVVAGATSEGAVRYRMLEPIRQYARKSLMRSGKPTRRGQRRSSSWPWPKEAEPSWTGRSRDSGWSGWTEEHDNLGAALSWALEHGEGELALRLGAALWRFWFARGYYGEGTTWTRASPRCR